jgi:hypothetical protein
MDDNPLMLHHLHFCASAVSTEMKLRRARYDPSLLVVSEAYISDLDSVRASDAKVTESIVHNP